MTPIEDLRPTNLKTKSIISIVALVLFLTSLGVVNYVLVRQSMNHLSEMIDVTGKANDLRLLSGSVTEGLPYQIELYSLHPDPQARSGIEDIYRQIDSNIAQLDTWIRDPAGRDQLGLVRNMFRSSQEDFNEIDSKLTAKASFAEINELTSDIKDSSLLIAEAIQRLISNELSEQERLKTELARKADLNGYLFMILGAFASILGIFLFYTLLIRKNILAPLYNMRDTMEKIANDAADIRLRVEVESKDEIGLLGQYFNKMADTLQGYKEYLEQLVETRSQALRTAEQANAAKSAFLANMSHELRTPMHGILSYARFGQQKFETAPKEKLKSYFDEIHDSGSRLMVLLNDLLDLSKLEAGKVVYDVQEVDLLQLARGIGTELGAFVEERKLRLEFDQNSQGGAVLGDRTRISQVIRNLISNAIKFSTSGTTIEIGVVDLDNKLVLSVKNMGVAIPNDELEAIFDKFVQSSRTRNGSGGTGLGLAICKEIVSQHKGRIWAKSSPEGQTEFKVELPKAAFVAA